MDAASGALLVGAGTVGGVLSAIAGGAGIVTFPALLAVGLPPIVANASNSIAVVPGHLAAAFADRERLPSVDRKLGLAIFATLVGSMLGSILLLATPERMFSALVPVLIGAATALFAFGKRIQARLAGLERAETSIRPWLLIPTTAYGGYFGAGLGVLMLVVLTTTGREDLRSANALKNLLASVVSLVTLAIFTQRQIVDWPATFAVFAGATAGGIIGGRLAAAIPAAVLRRAVIALGVVMTLTFAWRYWM